MDYDEFDDDGVGGALSVTGDLRSVFPRARLIGRRAATTTTCDGCGTCCEVAHATCSHFVTGEPVDFCSACYEVASQGVPE